MENNSHEVYISQMDCKKKQKRKICERCIAKIAGDYIGSFYGLRIGFSIGIGIGSSALPLWI